MRLGGYFEMRVCLHAILGSKASTKGARIPRMNGNNATEVVDGEVNCGGN